MTKCSRFRTIICLLTVLSAAVDAAPAPDMMLRRHSRRHLEASDQPAWMNPCGGSRPVLSTSSSSGSSSSESASTSAMADEEFNDLHPLKLLQSAVEVSSNKLSGLQEIKTDDITTWYNMNRTYNKFLHHNRRANRTDKMAALSKWHYDTQLYVGAFQQLLRHQLDVDKLVNIGHRMSSELNELLSLAKSNLCELQQTIERMGSTVPETLSASEMDAKLAYLVRSKNHAVHVMFAKTRYIEYVAGESAHLARFQAATVTSKPQHTTTPSTRSLLNQRQHLLEKRRTQKAELAELRKQLNGAQLTKPQRCKLEKKRQRKQRQFQNTVRRLRAMREEQERRRQLMAAQAGPRRPSLKIGVAEQRRQQRSQH